MEKFIFLATIKSRLEALDVPSETIDKHLFVFEKCFKGKTAEDIDRVIRGAGGIDGIIQSIHNLELAKKRSISDIPKPEQDKANISNSVPDAPVSEPQEETIEINVSSDADSFDEVDSNELTAEYLAVDIESFEDEHEKQEPEENEETVVDLNVNIQKSPDFEKHVEEAEQITYELEKTANNNIIKEAVNDSESEFDISEYDFDTLFAQKKSKIEIQLTNLRKNMTDKTYKATLPISIFAFVLAFAVASLLFPLLVISGIAISVGYILFLVGGIIFSLIPIGYGVYMSFSAISIGLYEIGIGLTAVGIVMLSCILMYNYVKRLLPYLLTKSKVLFKFCVKMAKLYFFKEIKEEA
ncbi:MAG: hypothetical protein E7593_04305 [Ruminococcaceae bacterium]|nr:hypothetical protein [Oscillospiraceae bacterium]